MLSSISPNGRNVLKRATKKDAALIAHSVVVCIILHRLALIKAPVPAITPCSGSSMIGNHVPTEDMSFAEKGREILERGDIPAAMEYYRKSFDPDALDEVEARTMLIEARALLSRKHLLEALEAFEEALLMGTEVQRRQALEGIAAVGRLRAGIRGLSAKLKKNLNQALGKASLGNLGLAFMGESENLALITREAVSFLPDNLARAGRVQSIPTHLKGEDLPLDTDVCVLYSEPPDLQIIKDIAVFLAKRAETPQADSP